MKNNRPYLLLGASGGPRIISSVLQTILNVVDFKMDLRRAIEAPRIHHQWVPNVLQVEKSVPITEVRSLERRGHEVQERQALGAVQAIVIQRGKATTESDPRRAQRPTDADGRPKPAD
jgi:gamma-glutamyltranspeptidase/glutathione hydrolase